MQKIWYISTMLIQHSLDQIQKFQEWQCNTIYIMRILEYYYSIRICYKSWKAFYCGFVGQFPLKCINGLDYSFSKGMRFINANNWVNWWNYHHFNVIFELIWFQQILSTKWLKPNSSSRPSLKYYSNFNPTIKFSTSSSNCF